MGKLLTPGFNSADSFILAGTTWSSDFPTPNGYETTYDGNNDVFLGQFSSTGTLQRSAFLGGGNLDKGDTIKVVALMALAVLGSGAVSMLIYLYYKRERVPQ